MTRTVPAAPAVSAALVAALVSALLALSVVTAPAAHAARANREVSIAGKEPKDNRFVVVGRVSPVPGRSINVRIQIMDCKRDLRCSSGWRLFGKARTNDKGRYRMKVRGPKDGYNRVYYRAHVVRTPKWQADVSREIYIHRVS
ncbi:hypothetical protein [Nocardioides bruguierae]|uniref:hypothetical protein n=1 Tax=Nocardioides bruguierae TaxID=2945102 RepID=UPI00202285DB|nr:hypothetical protein [Nocardioides bruguierae]MCL8023789.1 hypothetical protein [Nocardioides bruguierae]